MPAWKIGSGEVDNLPLLQCLIDTGRPVLLSSGMSSWPELDSAVDLLGAGNSEYLLMQCTSSYPCPAEETGLNVMLEMNRRYGCPVGLSDHSGTVYPGLAAAALGGCCIEVHTVFSRECFGPDVKSSITTAELGQLVAGIRFIQTALANPVDKNTASVSRSEMKRLFGKSLVAARDLTPGERLSASDLLIRKPGTGLPARHLPDIIGRKIPRLYSRGEFLDANDFR
jgi:N-acetylneuraminate synthase